MTVVVSTPTLIIAWISSQVFRMDQLAVAVIAVVSMTIVVSGFLSVGVTVEASRVASPRRPLGNSIMNFAVLIRH